jgi:exopolysaccharide biosynthesis protein
VENTVGVTLYEEHLILRTLGCSMGINLDGGGSSQISNNGVVYAAETPGNDRRVAVMVKVDY